MQHLPTPSPHKMPTPSPILFYGVWCKNLVHYSLLSLFNSSFFFLSRHICIELSCLVPRVVRRVRPLPGVSRTCAVMIKCLETPIHINLLEEFRKRQVRLRLKRACQGAKLPPPYLKCRSGQPFEELRKRPVRLRLKRALPAASSLLGILFASDINLGTAPSRQRRQTGTAILAGDRPHRFFSVTNVHSRYTTVVLLD